MESLECRTLLAAVSDNSGLLSIDLSANEALQIRSDGGSYSFFTTAANFTNNGVAEADDFSGFGSQNLVLDDLGQYSSLQITDSGAGASVEFIDSGTNSYSHNIDINLGDGAASRSVIFGGGSHFGNQNLTVNTDGSIQMTSGTDLTTANGDISLTSNNISTNNAAMRGIALVEASISTTGSGDISLTGRATDHGPTSDFRIGISLQVNSVISSTATGSAAGRITINGTGGKGVNANYGVLVSDGSQITSVDSAVVIGGVAGQGTGNDNFGALLRGLIGSNVSTSDITLTADTANFTNTATIQSTGELKIVPHSADTSISLGNNMGTLAFSDQELATLKDGFSHITFGDTQSGTGHFYFEEVNLLDPVTLAGGQVSDATGVDITAPSVTLSGDVRPGIANPNPSIEIMRIAGDGRLAAGGSLQLDIGGKVPGQSHDQLEATGKVDIDADVRLVAQWMAPWDAMPNDSVTIVKRAGGTGTFADLPEGAVVPYFFDATISYVGGDGDDIVLTLPATLPSAKKIHLANLGADGVTVFGTDAGDQSGQAVHRAGDVNGDGIDDFLIGANKADSVNNDRFETGEAYLIYGDKNLPETIDLATLGAAGVVIYGAGVEEVGAHFVDAADINKDGFNDLIIGAHRGDAANDAKQSAGDAYIVWGGPSLPQTIDLETLGNAGVTIHGADAGDVTGNPVAAAGDVNGDGFQDVGIGSIWGDSVNNSRQNAGEATIIFGGTNLPSVIDLASPGNLAVTIHGIDPGDEAGVAVTSLGDINGDDIDDVIIGARYADGPNNQRSKAGGSYVVYGRTSLSGNIDLATNADIIIYGADAHDNSGWRAGGGGDINGDGFNDIFIGASGADSVNNNRSNAGESYVIFGGTSMPAAFDLATLGNAGVTIFGADTNDFSGRSVDIVGDLNSDGFDDMLIGARHGDGETDTNSSSGETYVIYGAATLPPVLDLTMPGIADIILFGVDSSDQSGIMARGAGDVNDDGVLDLIIGARFADSVNNSRNDAGESYVIFGMSDAPDPGFSVSTSTLVVSESGTTGTVQVGLTAQPVQNVVLDVSSSDTDEATVGPNKLTFTPANWNTPQTATITGVDDDIIDGNQDAIVTFSINDAESDDAFDSLADQTVSVTNVDDDGAGFTLSKTSASMSEVGADTLSATLNRAPAFNVVLAVASDDLTAATVDPETLTFTPANWDSPQTVTISGVDDDVVDGDQTSSATVSVVDDASDDEFDDVPDQIVTVTTTDDDSAGFSVSTNTASVSESGTTAAFTVVLDRGPLSDVVMNISSSDTGEATVGPNTLTFTPANWNSPQTVTITGVYDAIIDGNQTATVTLSVNEADSDDAFDSLADQSISVTNVDDDSAGFTLSKTNASMSEVGIDILSVQLNLAPASDVVLAVVSDDLTAATVNSETLTFTPANWASPQTVTIKGTDDDVVDGDQTSHVTVSVVDDASDDTFDDVPDQNVNVTTTDNDSAAFSVSKITAPVSESGTTESFTVVLDRGPLSDVVMNVAIDDETEATVDATTLTFTPANWNAAQTVTVTGVDDDIVDGSQVSIVSISVDANASADAFDAVATRTVDVTTTDNDTAGFDISPSEITVSESGTNESFNVVLSQAPVSDVVLGITASDTGEATTDAESLTFTPGNWNAPQTVNVTGQNDNARDGDQTSTITVSVSDDASDDAFDTLSDQIVSVTTTDDETSEITIAGQTLSVSETGSTDTFTVALDSQPSGTVFLNVASADTGEAVVSPSVLVFNAGNWNQPQTVTATGVDDDVIDGHQSTELTVTIDESQSDEAWHSLTDHSVLVTTLDDDKLPGNIDGDVDFDANDSFLIHLAQLAGTDAQIDTSKGTSSHTASQIRGNISLIGSMADVDNDGDFDANDSFLIHLVKLSGTNAQIESAKGLSQLTATQIRANVDRLGEEPSNRSAGRSARRIFVAPSPASMRPDLFANIHPADDDSLNSASGDNELSGSAEFTDQEFRNWIDAI